VLVGCCVGCADAVLGDGSVYLIFEMTQNLCLLRTRVGSCVAVSITRMTIRSPNQARTNLKILYTVFSLDWLYSVRSSRLFLGVAQWSSLFVTSALCTVRAWSFPMNRIHSAPNVPILELFDFFSYKHTTIHTYYLLLP
jgi:hypothetical protein